MFSRNSLPKFLTGSPITAKDLNALREEVMRLGRVRGSDPIAVTSNATGISIGLGDDGGIANLGYAVLAEQINYLGSGMGSPYKVNNPPDGGWEVDSETSHRIKLYAPPTMQYVEYYPVGITVTYFYSARYKRYCIISSPYCSC